MVITIGSNQWTCSLASTYDELTQGLSGIESLPAGEGMLFDMGSDCSHIDINMQEMLFPLDIVFINSNLTVVGVLHDVQPNDEAYFDASNSLGARYFMEVNAGEGASVNVGDVVAIQGYTPGQTMDISAMIGYMIPMMMMVMMMKMVGNAI
jgi:uncharacterized membrane protein (UPF0127 family)